MAVLLVAMAVMLILMTVAMPVWRQQARREREEELLFRLKQYAHALALYQRKVPGAAPGSVDDLVKQRFLRRKYLDPITGKEFAILRVGQVSPGMTSPLPGLPGTGGPGGTAGQAGRNGNAAGASGPGATSRSPGSPSVGISQPGTVGGVTGGAIGGIRGVVSTSKDSSLRIWKGRMQYDQWEVTPEDLTPRFPTTNQTQPGQDTGAGRTGPGTRTRPGVGPSQPARPSGPGVTRPR